MVYTSNSFEKHSNFMGDDRTCSWRIRYLNIIGNVTLRQLVHDRRSPDMVSFCNLINAFRNTQIAERIESIGHAINLFQHSITFGSAGATDVCISDVRPPGSFISLKTLIQAVAQVWRSSFQFYKFLRRLQQFHAIYNAG